MLYIGIDLGTSSVKLLLMDGEGAILKTVTRTYPVSYPRPGWSEQDPADWYRGVVSGIKELTASCGGADVAGIGCAGQMHGLVMLDTDGCVIRPAILWNDGRCQEETDYLNNVTGRDRLSSLTANIAFAGFTAPKLMWVRKHEPGNFARIDKIMLPKDYINYMLTGVHCTDVSDASGTLLFDVEHKCWSKRMLDICGIREEQMPRIYESADTVGLLKPEITEELGLHYPVKVCAGAGDNAAAAVGTGTVGNGQCNISLGTSGTIFISSSSFGVDRYNSLHSFAHADGGYHLMGCMLSAAGCNQWWLGNIIGTDDYVSEQAAITDDMLGSGHVYFLPYLMGERSPINDTSARGTFLGMTMDTTRTDMTLAVLEGVAFAIRDSLEVARQLGLDIRTSRICGGGAKSTLWCRIISNVCGLDIEKVQTEEGPGYGGAILAAVACGKFGSVSEASLRLAKAAETIHPDPVISERYRQRYDVFRRLYPALKSIFRML